MAGRECIRHPGTAAEYYCAKYDLYLCEDCLACQNPALYCKSRTMCVIWEVSRRERRGERQEGGESG